MKMKKLAVLGITGALAISTFVGCSGVSATVDSQQTETALASSKEKKAESTDKVADAIGVKKSNSNTDSKDETVYVFCDAKGQITKTLVSEELHNASGKDEITDKTDLKDIVNLTGDEEYTKNSDGTITWKANGSDITYQGTTTAKVPVDMKVTYYLNGKEIAPEDIAGKSGKVKIRFDYKNNQTGTITVNGTKKTTAVPFTVVTGVDLDKEKFTNVEVENGTVTEGANGNMVVGLVMPGLKDSLELSFGGEKLDLDLPEYFEISADAEDFELDSIMCMVTSGLASNLELGEFDGLNVDGQMGELEDASTQLVDGASQLADGTKQLYDNIPALTDGVNKLDKGASDLKDGAGKVNDGAKKLDSGVGQLQGSVDQKLVPGVNQLKEGSAQLAAGVDTLAATINGMGGQIATAKTGVIAKVNESLAPYGITYETLPAAIQNAEAQRDTAIATLASLTDEQCLGAYAQAKGIPDVSYIPAEQHAAICAGVRQQYVDGINQANASIAQLYAAKYQADGAISALDQVGASLSNPETAQKLQQLTQGAHQLDEGLGQLQSGMGDLSTGVNQLKGGSSQLASGTGSLYEGTNTLKNGTGEFQSKTKTLVDGASALNDGANKLRDGMTQFDEEGIQKIVDMVDVDAKEVVDTIKGVAELGNDYNSFAGKTDDREGSCVFIYKLSGVRAE